MSTRPRRERRTAPAELDALLAVGDFRAVRDRARAILAEAAASDDATGAARAALARVAPERGAALAAAVGAALFVAAAVLGLLRP